MLLKPPGTRHSNSIGRTGTHTILIQIAPESLLPLHAPALAGAGIHVDARICRIAEDMLRELHQSDRARALGLDALIAELLELVGDRGQRAGRGYSLAQPWLGLVRDRLHDEPAHAFTLNELAQLAGVHRGHVAKGFRIAFGCTIGEYVRALRVHELARRLRADHTPLARLAAQLGFYDQPHLTRHFRAAYGVTPRTYRTLHGLHAQAGGRLGESIRPPDQRYLQR